jgi:DNA polymerase III delta prime subunit
MENIPWVEKYRPKNFNSIVIDETNRTILNNVINENYFPNFLFYGPPGTGKTTTIINLINLFQEKNGEVNKGLMIHLNASDERGIDVIRNQIYQFINSKPLFSNGIKFIILDEVDYMTKNAQQALKYILKSVNKNVKFCLICNYISKIEESLQNEFIRLRFNELPKVEIMNFLQHICDNEEIYIDYSILENIINSYKSDMRSMINFLQSNQHILKIENNNIIKVLNDNVFDDISKNIKSNKNLNNYINTISINYNQDIKDIIKKYILYIVRNKKEYITSDFLNFVENILHTQKYNLNHFIDYFCLNIKKYVN